MTTISHVYRYTRRKRGSYTKDDLLDPGDGGAYKPDKPGKPTEGVSFDNPLYVGSNEEDMLNLIGSEVTSQVEPDDHTTDGTKKVDLTFNEYEPL